MSLDHEMEQWRTGWTESAEAQPGLLPDFGRDAMRQESRLRRKVTFQAGVGVIFLISSLAISIFFRTAEMMLWAACIWLIVFIEFGFLVWNWQILWNSSTRSVTDFVHLSKGRTIATIRATSFGFASLIIQDCISVSWFSIDLALGRVAWYVFGCAMAVIAVINLVAIYSLIGRRRNAKRELAAIENGDVDSPVV